MARPKRGRGRPPHPDVLTPAEWRVVNAVRHGMTNREIGQRLGISIDAVSRQVGDISRAVDWYKSVLGLPHLYTFGDLAFFDCGGTRLFLTSRKEEGSAGESILYFSTPNIDASYKELLARGVVFHGAPHMIHRHDSSIEEWMAFFEDPDGQLLALMSRIEPA